MRNKTRNVIRRAEEQFTVRELTDISRFLWMCEKNLAARGLRNHNDAKTCTGLLSAALSRERGRIIAAHDEDGQIVAAIFCAWDNVTEFYMM
jgi:hypothetical protein